MAIHRVPASPRETSLTCTLDGVVAARGRSGSPARGRNGWQSGRRPQPLPQACDQATGLNRCQRLRVLSSRARPALSVRAKTRAAVEGGRRWSRVCCWSPLRSGRGSSHLGVRRRRGIFLRRGFPPDSSSSRAAPDGAVRFPMFAAFDDRGRLFVAESSGLDLYAEIAAGTRNCRVQRAGGPRRRRPLRGVARLRRRAGLPDGSGLARRPALRRRPARPGRAGGRRRRRPRRPPHGDPHRLRPHRQRQPPRPDLRPRRAGST